MGAGKGEVLYHAVAADYDTMTKFNYKKISGTVISGQGKGRRLGFPTMNIELTDGLESGVYAGKVEICGKKNNTTPPPRLRAGHLPLTEGRGKEEDMVYSAGIFVSRDRKILEAYLIGFEGDLYGKEVEIEIIKKIREAMNFKSEEELKKQIEDDLKAITNN